MSRLVARYEAVQSTISSKYNEQGGGAQVAFFDKVEKLFTALKEMNNAFEEKSTDLLVLDTMGIADPAR